MNKRLKIYNNPGYDLDLNTVPIKCPYCHNHQIPSMYGSYLANDHNYFIFCSCTNSECKACFTVLYDNFENKFRNIKQSKLQKSVFDKIIEEVSPSFCEIYNQAYAAEQMDLDQVCGVGYRKALEFLIKDYLISLNPDKEDKIKNKLLGNCIKDDVTDTNIKIVSERAAWLGNDETHYVRKWDGKDVSHLKGLINLCLHWIEAEIKTKKILSEMPEGI